jgi:hypothetical protein
MLQEELIGIITNEELKVQFRKGYQQFWLQRDIPVTYPALWTVARKFLIAFPSSYLVERGFSVVANLLKKRLEITSLFWNALGETLPSVSLCFGTLQYKYYTA